MKILLIGVFKENSTSFVHEKGFLEAGCQVIRYDYRKNRGDQGIIEKCKKEKPDIIFFPKCNGVHYRVIEECKKIGKTILWYMDGIAPHCFNQELFEKIKRCDVFACGIEGGVKKGLELNPNTNYIFQPADDSINKPLDIKKDIDVSFIGDMGMTPAHRGRRKFYNFVKFTHFNGVYGVKHNQIVNRSKINLNFAPPNGAGTSVRLYKLLLSGAFILTTTWIDMEKTFTIGDHLDVFKTPEELESKINYYLSNPNEMERIRGNILELRKIYTPKKWAETILKL